ncbi:short-chain dehydrogenase [Halobacteriales archaeon QS_8_69_26]|nr:MAG: short-chain dehydrogenase [Halobacteriales archaeon QS_8_69_26]
MSRTAVVAGVGPGLGESIARKFAREGCQVGLFARSGDYIEDLADDLQGIRGADAVAVRTDLADPAAIHDGFARVRKAFGPVDVLVNHASAGAWSGLLESSLGEFERAWAVNGRGAFVCSQEAAGDMVENGGGTILFTGATSAVRGRGGAVGFSAAKFAARGMAQSMASELGPEGVHVAHVVIDGGIRPPEGIPADADEDDYLDPDEIAGTYWGLVDQSGTDTMTHEVHVTNGTRNIEFL